MGIFEIKLPNHGKTDRTTKRRVWQILPVMRAQHNDQVAYAKLSTSAIDGDEHAGEEETSTRASGYCFQIDPLVGNDAKPDRLADQIRQGLLHFIRYPGKSQ